MIDFMQAVTWQAVALAGIAGAVVILVCLICGVSCVRLCYSPEDRAKADVMRARAGIVAEEPDRQECDSEDNVSGFCPRTPGCVSRWECERTLKNAGCSVPLEMASLERLDNKREE